MNARVTDRVDDLLASADRLILRAGKRIDEGRGADAFLGMALSELLSAVRELAKRNDPLAAEKAEAEKAASMPDFDTFMATEAEE